MNSHRSGLTPGAMPTPTIVKATVPPGTSTALMTITLSPDHEKAIAEAIHSGSYDSPDAVIARALEVLRGEEHWLHGQKHQIADKIDRAFAQFDRREYRSSEESGADMQKRKAAWIAQQNG